MPLLSAVPLRLMLSSLRQLHTRRAVTMLMVGCFEANVSCISRMRRLMLLTGPMTRYAALP